MSEQATTIEGSADADLMARIETFLSTKVLGPWIDNALHEGGGERFESLNPATGAVLATLQAAAPEDVDRAVASAHRALEGPWSKVTPADRARLLWRLADLVDEHHDELSALETMECGKPIKFTGGYDIPTVSSMFRYFAGWTTKNTGQVLPVSSGDFHCYTRHEPVGVCAGIIPWNSPLAMASWKLAPALACGNVMIIKPAEQTPLTMLRLAELTREAGFPPGVINVLPGYGEVTGAALAVHPKVDKVAFTGGHETGRRIVEAAAGDLKRVSLELGGKSPNIVFPDAPDDVVIGALWGIYFNSGQSCSAGSRLFVDAAVYDDVLSELAKATADLKIGPGIDPATDIGPLISEAHLGRVLDYLRVARDERASTVIGGERYVDDGLDSGYFVTPTILTDTSNESRIAQEEIFGPVVAVMPFSSEAELIAKANDSVYGLAAGVWTADVKRAHRVAAALKAGSVWVNCYGAADPAVPFGGYGMSGWGREMGSYALELYTEVKAVWVAL